MSDSDNVRLAPSPGPIRLHGMALVEALANPVSVAVVGASAEAGSYSNRALTFMKERGFAGKIYPVNPKYTTLLGLDCYPRAQAIPDSTVQVALVGTQAKFVLQACNDLAEIGTKVAVVFATGLTDQDRLGLRRLAIASGMRIVGPDCIGTVSVESGAYLTFSRVAARAPARRGSIALVTQSGAMGNSILISLYNRGLSISHWISSGGELDVGAMELAAGLSGRDDVSAVALYLEGVTDPSWVTPLADAISATGKLVVAVRGAVSTAGRAAAAGHTGRVVGAAAVSRAVMVEAGIQLVPSIPALVDVLAVSARLRVPYGGRVGVVTVSGGAGVLTADAISETGILEMAELSNDPELEGRLEGRVTEVANPLDVPVGDEDVFCEWVGAVAGRPAVDVTIAIQARLMHDDERFVQAMVKRASYGPTVVTTFNEDEQLSPASVVTLGEHGVAYVPTPERAVAALAVVRSHRERRRGRVPKGHFDSHSAEVAGGLEAAVALLGPDLPWVDFSVVKNKDDALTIAENYGFPVVIKAAGRSLQHRAEAGAVAVNVNASDFNETFDRISIAAARAGDAVIVQRQASPGLELMLSLVVDAEVGPAVIVRPGGTLVELGLDESAILWSQWNSEQLARALSESLVGRLLAGYRGHAAYDVTSLLVLTEHLFRSAGEGSVTFAEFNPVIVGREGIALVDALVR